VRAVPRLCEFYPGICLTTEEKAWNNLSQGKKNLIQRENPQSDLRKDNKLRYSTTSLWCEGKGKGKTIPVQACYGFQQGFETVGT
jgi:hypothetical protein